MRSVFDITGPIMIGPSSSHTAGAARIGFMARTILGEDIVQARIYLHGSFADTYKGHGTDRALIAGLMGFCPDDERLKDALNIARDRQIDFTFIRTNFDDAHPNTAKLDLVGVHGHKVSVTGVSIGGGNILINKLNEYDIKLSGKYASIIVVHQDMPGVIHGVTAALARFNINIAKMKVWRNTRGAEALMNIEMDEQVSDDALESVENVIGVSKVIRIDAIS